MLCFTVLLRCVQAQAALRSEFDDKLNETELALTGRVQSDLAGRRLQPASWRRSWRGSGGTHAVSTRAVVSCSSKPCYNVNGCDARLHIMSVAQQHLRSVYALLIHCQA